MTVSQASDPPGASHGSSHDRASLLVATEMDPWSSSTRYRALQYVDGLSSDFSEVAVSLPSDTVPRAPGRAGQLRYFGTHLAHYGARCVSIHAELRSADVVFVQRGLYPLGPSWVARPFRRYAGRVVLDLDDAVFETKPSLSGRRAAVRWLYGPQQARELLARADAIVVSSHDLLEALPPVAATRVVLPTVPDPSRYPVVSHGEAVPAVVGWAGTVGNIRYLEPLRPVFARLARDGVARLEVVSSEAWSGPSTFHRWALPEEASVFTRFSIGIMPLPDTPYTRAKAGFKLLQYMAAGLPVVASPIGVNRELIERSQAGILASSSAEWEEALRSLALDVDLRRQLGERARAFVESFVSDAAVPARLAAILRGGDGSCPPRS